ncbi:5-(carboxyamino)imidazole ribonucleotide mutase [Ligilactobacillus apodemi]|nr:5-(carboxyamino)imidazole ribonucleotide mutase [Ligilactobacillus apodemi]MCR1900415.1 5-(carboxyamino)imidazole ribonucleotide mutase [Ligilactobacillus apodemi]
MSNRISIVMGSYSDWETMKNTAEVLDEFGVKYDKAVISAHRMPEEMLSFAKGAVANGIEVIIAGAGGAAHLPGMIAANTVLPVIGVPVQSRALNGLDSLLSIVQMPAGVPVATTAIGVAGAKNAALLALQILGVTDKDIQAKLLSYRKEMHDKAVESGDLLE